jgi:uncharacterized membrane protein (DUF106 family)
MTPDKTKQQRNIKYIVEFIYFVIFIALLGTVRNQLFMLFKGVPHIVVIIVYGAITGFYLPLIEKVVGAFLAKAKLSN